VEVGVDGQELQNFARAFARFVGSANCGAPMRRNQIAALLLNDRPRPGLEAALLDSISIDDFSGGASAAQLLASQGTLRKGTLRRRNRAANLQCSLARWTMHVLKNVATAFSPLCRTLRL
jgi:hypothetical protein